MRTVNNGINVYSFEDLNTEVKFKLYEELVGEEVVFMDEEDMNRIQAYYEGVEFYEDGTVYEEV